MRVLIVDDEPVARLGIRKALAREASVEIIGECGTGRQALRMLREFTPDLVYLDVQLPGLDGFDVVEQLGAPIIREDEFDRLMIVTVPSQGKPSVLTLRFGRFEPPPPTLHSHSAYIASTLGEWWRNASAWFAAAEAMDFMHSCFRGIQATRNGRANRKAIPESGSRESTPRLPQSAAGKPEKYGPGSRVRIGSSRNYD